MTIAGCDDAWEMKELTKQESLILFAHDPIIKQPFSKKVIKKIR